MRIVAIVLPELRVEIARANEILPGQNILSLVCVVGSVAKESDILGNTRLVAVSKDARALGILPGSTVAQARAKAATLAVRVVRDEGAKFALERIAEAALGFGATAEVVLAPERDAVLLDVTGCARLHGADEVEGEARLLELLGALLRELGHEALLAIADGPRIAHAIARGLGRKTIYGTKAIRVRPGENVAALAPMPMAFLPLGERDLWRFDRLGLSTIGDVQRLPRSELVLRLGALAKDIDVFLTGDDRKPLVPYVPKEAPEERLEFDDGVRSTESLAFVARTLVDRLIVRIKGRGLAVSKVELFFDLDLAAVGRGKRTTRTIPLVLGAPLVKVDDLLRVVRAKLERIGGTKEASFAPVLAFGIRATELVRARAVALSLFEAEPASARVLPRLVAELAADGCEVGRLVLVDSWEPSRRTSLESSFSGKMQDAPFQGRPCFGEGRGAIVNGTGIPGAVPEIDVLLEVEETPRGANDAVKPVRFLARLAPSWWRSGKKSVRDVLLAERNDGVAFVVSDRSTNVQTVIGYLD